MSGTAAASPSMSSDTLYALVQEEAFGRTAALGSGDEADLVFRELLGEPEWLEEIAQTSECSS
jgi:hypothetical protein